MRVLHLNDLHDPSIGSSIRQMYQLAELQRAAGHEAAVLTATPQERDATPTEILGSRVFRVHSRYDPRWRAWVGLRNRRALPAIERVLDEYRPDLVHAHLIHTHLSYAALTAARARGAAVVFTAHDVMTFCYQKLTCFHGGEQQRGARRDYQANWQKCLPCQRLRWRPDRNARIRAILARDVQRFTAVSHELARAIRANGIRVDRVVHNAIPGTLVLPGAEALGRFREAHGLVGKRVITIAGRLHEQKGVLQLFRMLAILGRELPDVRLMVMGHRKVYDEEFAVPARHLGIDGYVVPTGWLDGEELAAAYSATDVFVTPSICFDTFGLVNLEAMEHEKPVVATCFGGSPEVVEHGVTGYVANPFAVDEFAGRIRELLLDADLARRFGRAGRRRMLERFRTDRLAREFEQEYALALAAARAPSG